MNKLAFVKQYLPAARTAGDLYRLNPVVILAQAAIETSWGESLLARQYNNFFGMTGFGVANAYWHGGKTDLGGDGLVYRRYITAENSFLDFARMVANVYPTAATVSNYPAAYAREMAYSRFVSQLNGSNRAAYEEMLIKISWELEPLVHIFSQDEELKIAC